jgi:signal transduction histidine kinase
MTMNMLRRYLKRFAEWAIALRERYVTDLFFRTTVQIISLQAVLVLVCLLAFLFSLYNPGEEWDAFGGVLVLSLLFGALLARFTLGPARDTLRYQKLFISNVAHELRTPIAVIKTSTEVALIDSSLPPDVRTTFNEIVAELDRISEILNNLLSLNTLTRPERMQFSNVELGGVVETVVRQHAILANERGIKVTVQKGPYTYCRANAVAIEQVVANLVKNAISYTPRGGNSAVRIDIGHEGPMLKLAVADNGIGISQEDLFHIFEPFYRADMSRVRRIKKSGSGLGLTIVNEIVRVHHGKIQIQSALRKGTTVLVYLPCGTGDAAPEFVRTGADASEISLDFSTNHSAAASEFASANR